MLVILLVDFHVHCWLLLSKRAHLKESPAKKATSTENFGGADPPSVPPPPAPEGLNKHAKCDAHIFHIGNTKILLDNDKVANFSLTLALSN